MIGWHGVEAKPDTDRTANPLLQDVNKGWLQLVREQAPQQILTEGLTPGKIQIGGTGDYRNLDGLVLDVSLMIDEEFRDGGDLVVTSFDNLSIYFQDTSWRCSRPLA